MRTRIRIGFVTVLAVAALAGMLRAGQNTGSQSTAAFSGWLTDDMCAEKGASPGHAACVKMCIAEHGARYALYDASAKKLYLLDPPNKLAGFEGEEVVIQGKLDGHTIHVESIAAKPASGS